MEGIIWLSGLSKLGRIVRRYRNGGAEVVPRAQHGAKRVAHRFEAAQRVLIQVHGPLECQLNRRRKVLRGRVRISAQEKRWGVPRQQGIGHVLGPRHLGKLQGQHQRIFRDLRPGCNRERRVGLRYTQQGIQERRPDRRYAGGDGVHRIHHGHATTARVHEFEGGGVEMRRECGRMHVVVLEGFIRNIALGTGVEYDAPFHHRHRLKKGGQAIVDVNLSPFSPIRALPKQAYRLRDQFMEFLAA